MFKTLHWYESEDKDTWNEQSWQELCWINYAVSGIWKLQKQQILSGIGHKNTLFLIFTCEG